MITLCTVRGRDWQTSAFGYNGQTHSLAELISEPTRKPKMAFCNCQKIRFLKWQHEYSVRRFGKAYKVTPIKDDCCPLCGHAVFWSNYYESKGAGNK